MSEVLIWSQQLPNTWTPSPHAPVTQIPTSWAPPYSESFPVFSQAGGVLPHQQQLCGSGCQRQKDIMQNRKKLLKKMLKTFLECTLSWGQTIIKPLPGPLPLTRPIWWGRKEPDLKLYGSCCSDRILPLPSEQLHQNCLGLVPNDPCQILNNKSYLRREFAPMRTLKMESFQNILLGKSQVHQPMALLI